MAIAWSELRGVHGHSAQVEFPDDWGAVPFSVERRGWGTVASVTAERPSGEAGPPFVWLHLTIASPLNEQAGRPLVSNPFILEKATAFFRTGGLAWLTDVHVRDGGRPFKVFDNLHVAGDLSAREFPPDGGRPTNTWVLNAELQIGVGLSLRFAFSEGLDPEQSVTIFGARAVFSRRGPAP